MKHTFLIILLAFNFVLFGQNSESDSLKKNLRNDAEWAIMHEDYHIAKGILDKLILEEPNNQENYYVKSMIYYYQKNPDSIKICLDYALKIGNDSMRVYREYYRYYLFQEENNNESLNYINKMIQLEPTNIDLYFERRDIWLSLENFDNSWKDLEKAASLGSEEAKKDMQDILETREKLKKLGIIE